MTVQQGEEKYAEALQRLFSDAAVRKGLEDNPIDTLEGLGLNLSDDAKAELRAGGSAEPELAVAAVPAVLVRVATNGTRPVVRVVVSSSTVSETRGEAKEFKK